MRYHEEYKDCLKYIDLYWRKIIFKPQKKVVNHKVITIPYTYITPNDKKFSFIYYWDTFFIFRGLHGTKYEWIMREMLNNFIYLYNKHALIPNFNSPASMNRSQPPFLSSMILDEYFTSQFIPAKKGMTLKVLDETLENHEKSWLKKTINVAKREYHHVWTDTESLYFHSVPGYCLARYGDRDIGYAHSSELESGWDFTSRFFNRCNEFLSVDLNVYLLKYEKDFAKVAKISNSEIDQDHWQKKADERKKEMQKYFWNEKKGFYFDYCYKRKEQSTFLSLAGFTPLWVGLPTAEQAKRIVTNLKYFETDYGLTITAKDSLYPFIDLSSVAMEYQYALRDVIKPKQWDYPNSWPPLEYLTVIGLLRYGFIDDAKRLMKKYLATHAGIFRKYGTFLEKINAVTGDKASHYDYALQQGFGWTNAVFYRYVRILDALEEGIDIYATPKLASAPYHLRIFH